MKLYNRTRFDLLQSAFWWGPCVRCVVWFYTLHMFLKLPHSSYKVAKVYNRIILDLLKSAFWLGLRARCVIRSGDFPHGSQIALFLVKV